MRWGILITSSPVGETSGAGLAADSTGNSYVTGRFEGTASFGSHTLTADQTSLFVAQLDPSGSFLWVVQAGPWAEGRGIAVDSAGSSYIAGQLEGTASFGAHTLTAKARDAFVAKLSPSGSFLWVNSAGASERLGGAGLAVNGKGSSYVTGWFDGTATFGTTHLTAKARDVFVAKLSPSGSFLWAVAAGGKWMDWGTDIAMDGAGNSYVTGFFVESAIFGSTTLAATDHQDAFVWKIGPNGPP